jgi:heptosyltransferase-2
MPGVAATHLLQAAHGELALQERWRAARALAVVGFDLAIVLPNSFKSALVPFWAGIPRRSGWTGELRVGLLNDRRRLDAAQLPLMIERFMMLGLEASATLQKPYPLPRLLADPANVRRLSESFRLQATGAVAMCPGAEYGPAKRWPVEHFAQAARELVARGHQVWLLGSAGDRGICADIESLVPKGVVNLAGATSLPDVVDVLSIAERVISNDSGLMHVACALGRPVAAIYGSTSPEFTPPLAQDAVILRQLLDCSPCFQRECPLGHLRCLRELTPERVIAAVVAQTPP